MTRIIFGALLLVVSFAASAQSATIICVGNIATLRINYPIGADAGQPGLFWLGIAAPDESAANYLDLSGNWQGYTGGLIPPTGRYDSGLPPVMSASVPLPGSPTNTFAFAGWMVGLGEGVLSPSAQQLVAQRRQYLNQVKAQKVANGTWAAGYDDDDEYRWSLIQEDLIANKKYQSALSIPQVDCEPPLGGGGY